MADLDPSFALNILKANRASLGADDAARDAYLKEAEARLGGRSADDRKEAAKLAVETAKMLLTVAVAVLVATGTFVQFARTNGVAWVSLPIGCFTATVILLFLSMTNGFSAISSAYKRADARGTGDLGKLPWSTEAIASKLNWQAKFGFLSLVALIVALVTWANSEESQLAAVSISIPSATKASVAKGPVTIEGTWAELRIRTVGNQEMKLPPNSSPVQLICK
jgi:hypothetical protein